MALVSVLVVYISASLQVIQPSSPIMSTTVTVTAQQPDIQYLPDFDKWKARTERRLRSETLSKELPPGFPKKLVSDLVWDGANIKDHYNWTYVLTDADLKELDDSLTHFKCKRIALRSWMM